VEETLMFSSEIVQMAKQFGGSMADSSSEKFSLFDEKQIKENAVKMGEGVRFVSAKPLKKGGREGYIATYSFKDIRRLKITQSPENAIPMNESEPEENGKEEIFTFDFQKGNTAKLVIKLPEQGFKKEDESEFDSTKHEQNDFGDLQKAKQFLKDMHISLVISVAGNISETDATYSEANRVTLFDVNFGELVKHEDKLMLLKERNPQSLEEAKEILKDIPGIKIEMNKNVVINFQ
jgi:hypothetical protein